MEAWVEAVVRFQILGPDAEREENPFRSVWANIEETAPGQTKDAVGRQRATGRHMSEGQGSSSTRDRGRWKFWWTRR